MIKCSLLIATYNWPAALELCLETVLHQTRIPDEIIIADDGSGEETKRVIEKFASKCPAAFKHVWQPDEGFQLARIRNKAIAAASHEYIIQVDGDLLLHPYFIADHLELCRQGYFVSGSRVLLSETSTKKIFQESKPFPIRYSARDRNFFNSLRCSWLRRWVAPFYKTSGSNIFYVKGCNMAFWKRDLLNVNGYNESFTGWGREDSELAIRLRNAGVKKQFLKMGGICYHLYHDEASRELEPKNTAMMHDAIKNKISWASKGLNQYLPA